MNILLMSRMVTRSGVGNHIKQLANELKSMGHNVYIITGSNALDISGLGGVYYANVLILNRLGLAQ